MEVMTVRVEKAMTEEERQGFLDDLIMLNPHLRGAHVADLLDMLAESDANLDVIEPMYEEHGNEVPEPRLLNYCTQVVLYQSSNRTAPWEKVSELIERVREWQ